MSTMTNLEHMSGLSPRALPSTPAEQTPSPSPTTLITLTTATTTSVSTTTTIAATPSVTERVIYYPPAVSHYALSVPSIVGILVAGVSFLVLLAIIAAFTVCFLGPKKESKAEKEERKRKRAEEKARVADTIENSSVTGDADAGGGNDNAGDTRNAGGVEEPSLIGPRYSRMIGMHSNNNATDPDPTTNAQSTKGAWKGKGKSRERMVVHLPVHVADLGTLRQSQVHYEREDPGDEERDERGFRRGASWWHPEL